MSEGCDTRSRWPQQRFADTFTAYASSLERIRRDQRRVGRRPHRIEVRDRGRSGLHAVTSLDCGEKLATNGTVLWQKAF